MNPKSVDLGDIFYRDGESSADYWLRAAAELKERVCTVLPASRRSGGSILLRVCPPPFTDDDGKGLAIGDDWFAHT